ncbi:MAG: hypothetical protein K0V04_38275, partial [Deltaproteobacteria bacterium]|nr:hypothetical protein [Deltaproteobacteria bacterium]
MKTLSPQLIVSTVSLLFVAAGIVPLAQAVAPASPQQQPDLQIPAGLFCEIDAFQLLPTLGPDGFPDIQKVQLSDEDQVIAGPIYINLSVANVGSLGADGLSTFFGVWGNRTKLLDLTDTTDLGVGAPYYESLV